MKIKLICVGPTNDGRIAQLFEEYEKRLKHYNPLEVVYLVNKKKLQDERKTKAIEAQQILTQVQTGSTLVLLDEKGQTFDSMGFSNFLQKRFNSGLKELVFVIGGAYGFTDDVYQRTDFQLALSKMTFTHQMVRIIFIEQLYRAFTILKGEKYHH